MRRDARHLLAGEDYSAAGTSTHTREDVFVARVVPLDKNVVPTAVGRPTAHWPEDA